MAAPTHDLVESFTTSLPFDRRLFAHDITGSIAHCEMLAPATDHSTKRDATRIITALRQIRSELERGTFQSSPADEDIHMAVERRLIEKIGADRRQAAHGAQPQRPGGARSAACTCKRRDA